ncbi:MAG TPA: hypothetical protein VNI57_01390 [Candidatus Saccharimonadales bacterium]|nr:hypothetical protein [Candidatus Saccharimonadales bacterium]
MSRRPKYDHARLRLEWESGLHPTLKALAEAHQAPPDYIRHVAASEQWKRPAKLAREAITRAMQDLYDLDAKFTTGEIRLRSAVVRHLLSLVLKPFSEKQAEEQRLIRELEEARKRYQAAAGDDKMQDRCLEDIRTAEEKLDECRKSSLIPKTLDDVVALCVAASKLQGGADDLVMNLAKLETLEERTRLLADAKKNASGPPVNVNAAPGSEIHVHVNGVQELIEKIGQAKRATAALPPATSEG